MSDPERPPRGGILDDGQTAETKLQLLEERVAIERRKVSGQTVRVATRTETREQVIAEPLARESVEVERVPIGRVVESTPEIRQEGDVTIVPVMEETLVLERRLVLKEEVRIRRVRTTQTHRETVRLREQTAVITRDGAGQAAITPQPIQPETKREIP